MSNLIVEKKNFRSGDLQHIKTIYINNYPIVYLLYNDNRKMAYIGQTVHAKRRMKEHLNNPGRSLYEQTLLIGHQQFNQSATFNIETNLINYFIADNKYKLQNVSQTATKQMHNYYQKHYYNEELFQDVWDKLIEEEIVTDSLEQLRNKDIFKLSPYKELSEQQLEIKMEILDFCRENMKKTGKHIFLVEGDAGTGKSVLLSSLFNTIQDYAHESSSPLADSDNYLLVNHGEMIKTYQSIAYSLPNLKKKNFMKPTPFINQMDKLSKKADIVLVDEAHLLLSKDDAYNNFKYDNQLEEIIKRSRIIILIFDSKQVLKLKSYWNKSMLDRILKPYRYKSFQLTDQFRMQARPEITDWIDQFVQKRLLPLPASDNYYEVKVFADSQQFKNAIQQKNKTHGLSRVISTFDYLHKKDGDIYMVDEAGVHMPWNITKHNATWAEQEHTIHEAGSTYTVQGFDLNYAGVVLGPSVQYDANKDELRIDPSEYKDTEAFRSRNDFSAQELEHRKEEIILNSINILMKRGIRGLYIYAADEQLRQRLLELKEEDNR